MGSQPFSAVRAQYARAPGCDPCGKQTLGWDRSECGGEAEEKSAGNIEDEHGRQAFDPGGMEPLTAKEGADLPANEDGQCEWPVVER